MIQTQILTNILLLLICTASFGQGFQKKPERNDFSPQAGRIFAKLSILNLFHPTAPSLDVGLEGMLNEKIGLEAMYGFRSGRLPYGPFDERIHLDQYQKIFGSVRFFPEGRSSLRDGLDPTPNFFALDVYTSSGKSTLKDNFALSGDTDARLDYESVQMEKKVWGLGLKFGYLVRVAQFLEFEWAMGMGLISYQRNYEEFVNPIIQSPSLSDDTIGPYNDKNIGRSDFVNLIIQAKINFLIF
ncbi:MAG: hypothetical protein AAF696_29700 [Bacteroidota bacterium]